jgi:hypothetical protein
MPRSGDWPGPWQKKEGYGRFLGGNTLICFKTAGDDDFFTGFARFFPIFSYAKVGKK